MQAGGRRFDPGTLHRRKARSAGLSVLRPGYGTLQIGLWSTVWSTGVFPKPRSCCSRASAALERRPSRRHLRGFPRLRQRRNGSPGTTFAGWPISITSMTVTTCACVLRHSARNSATFSAPRCLSSRRSLTSQSTNSARPVFKRFLDCPLALEAGGQRSPVDRPVPTPGVVSTIVGPGTRKPRVRQPQIPDCYHRRRSLCRPLAAGRGRVARLTAPPIGLIRVIGDLRVRAYRGQHCVATRSRTRLPMRHHFRAAAVAPPWPRRLALRRVRRG